MARPPGSTFVSRSDGSCAPAPPARARRGLGATPPRPDARPGRFAAPSRSATAGQLGVALAVGAALVAASGCGRDDAIDPAIAADIVTAAPALARPLDVDLGGKVLYLGGTPASLAVAPGGQASITHYWKVVAPPGDGWEVFAHLVSDDGDWLDVSPTPTRLAHPPARWRAGQVIRDVQRFTLPPSWAADHASLRLGLARRGVAGAAGRLPVVRGPHDAAGRVIAARFAVARPPAGADYVVRRATGPIALDGVADEPAWSLAPLGPAFTGAQGGKPVAGATVGRLLWDDGFLYAFVSSEDADVDSPYGRRDDALWKADVVELFIDADGDRRGYVELQVNPRGAVFDAWFPKNRGQQHHVEWNGGLRAGVKVDGTLGVAGDRDRGWDVEIAIPLVDVKGMDAAMDVRVPPAVGDRWRLNVVRIDKPPGQGIRAASWNPIPIADFHALGRMLTVRFGDADGRVGDEADAGR